MTESVYKRIKNQFESVKLRVQSAAQSAGRDPDEIRLMVVTKAHSVNIVKAVVASGARILGENYVEEAIPKINAIDNKDVEWHMIGHVQSRKARQVCDHFSWVHSLDRRKIARRLNDFAGQKNMKMPVLLECNISGEESKFGYPVWKPEQWPEFVDEVAFILELDNLEVKGLMTMPPWDTDPEASRPYFQYLRRLRAFLCQKYPEEGWKELSMGMSNDFEVAIQEGATIIRIGTAILGSRVNS
ncbi:hypothetical protein AMJ86_06860 [bacterium SM23_57]|jgi:pyridoxal phosphate enzyme (YggS family)|nr:MAG: hypothetical protein AMJ86_06860 [bacterium SM23_57]